ncbi:phosphate ABC transporter, permease protein PstA [candidate division WOR-1 bacterium RIFOXYA12_FULL_52_29]|uniref:Phosphate transport system permease protein PstA n=1 Tax=candidate division WOR-1 bacterium RIFOXYC12_FULL_54_18 TaxID=1802584 RepID=A0A1F4T4E3_UNCSA|nr:MAG: phosphate ABC transporter, permease protein PstA [candidate division WOR-1 bacterium RIFOXYA2_FULL_51_19]OGC17205.1 MAG: phosphate ABC transporter, permease protein PstA [candidate division WOR-1 bacterium RIFOXYA12_FULL_52_29]OGC26065.1 MAG: phosphate ABC transporter, permease protein PstA [candidate division WOR-1 bacterium RIFOXYB2_FULL_45_9]OGC27622.1 MAG: phosphate ABC transporter, permease protein PstA [candidate division WOR-1 bacterium RIFOXYC12_FULL_54_18]OGC29164.1 MAG: phosph
MIDSKLKEKAAFAILLAATIIVIAPVALILAIILINGLPALSFEFLFSIPRDGMRGGGIFPALVGTFYLIVGTALFAIPFGILAAIYLNEYAQRNRLTRAIELAIINLSGVPSIVYGLFGLSLFVEFLGFGASILAGSLTLAIMTLPVIITATREALSAVPRSFREVSFSLGASRWQTVRGVVLPNAIPGILTGTILGLSRAAGETAPILFTVAAFYLPKLPTSVYDQAMALPYHIYVLSTQVPNVSVKVQYGTVLVLVGMIFILNIVASYIRSYFRKKKTW